VIVLYVSTVYCVSFKVLESFIYAFVEPIIDSILPPEQARFRHWRSTVDQITSLTQDIEDTVGFWLSCRPEPCFSISQQPMLSQAHLQVTAIAIWQTHSAWSWRWLVFTASPLPPSRGAGQQHGEWPPQPWFTQRQSTALLPVATVLIPFHWFCHQRRLGNCDWMPASYTSPQPSHPRGLSISGALSQRSRSVSSTPCHGPGYLLHSALNCPPSGNARRLKSRHSFVPALLVHLTTTTTYVRRYGRITDGVRSGRRTLTKFGTFIPHPPGMVLPRTACVRP